MMHKRLAAFLLASLLSLYAPPQIFASESVNAPQEDIQLQCDVLRDAFIWSLFDPIGKVLAGYDDDRQFMVDKLVEIKRLEQGQYYWEATLKVTTFEGAHNPPYHNYTITFTNLFSKQPKAVNVQRTERTTYLQ
ncbi:Protein of unknown function [Paenibacillus sophorae]|uniref:DUF3888 domain-containing protein n=1 Tax=Paenibacillus sophorae TaxID=1333845 RepID=A0A1H8LGR9_9BACL|nr:DUF3888 domain-containing protein [Paenibacillus sophorae]QWU17294.1 DUF3888 domain-containing protein [Paenibacillus sophorae]SEO04317.1 Protein of unknown function [Paenibacillus sophorae]